VPDYGTEFQGQTLRVTAWSGPYAQAIRDVFVPSFEEATGAEIVVIDEWETIISRILAAPEDAPPYDLTITEGFTMFDGLESDLFLPIRYENVPNAVDLFPFFTSDVANAEVGGIPGQDWGVPFAYGYQVIGYDKEELGFTPTSWNDIWSDKVTGNIGADSGFFNYALGAAAFDIGLDPNSGDADDITAIIDHMAELSDRMVWFTTGAISRANLLNDEVDIQIMYIEDISPISQDDPKFGWVFPEEGAMGWIDRWSVVRGTQVQDLGEAFANHMLDPILQSAFAARETYWMANSKYTAPPGREDQFPLTNEDLLARTNLWHYDIWVPYFFDDTSVNGVPVYSTFATEALGQ
jgi:spermidine/putrescine transport system substrate-binding protein